MIIGIGVFLKNLKGIAIQIATSMLIFENYFGDSFGNIFG